MPGRSSMRVGVLRRPARRAAPGPVSEEPARVAGARPAAGAAGPEAVVALEVAVAPGPSPWLLTPPAEPAPVVPAPVVAPCTVTGLPLVDAFHDAVARALRAAGVEGGPARCGAPAVAVLVVAVREHDALTRTLGSSGGDALVAAAAGRLLAAVPGDALVGRLDGAVLAVLLPAAEDVLQVADQVLHAFAAPVLSGSASLQLNVRTAIACAPMDGTDAPALVARALAAADGLGPPLQDETLAAELRRALARGGVDVRFAPQVDARLGRLVGWSALAWWDHPDRGVLAPASFVPTAATHGLARDLTVRVLDVAAANAAAWLRAGHALACSVDVPTAYLLDTRLAADVACVLARHDLPAALLVLQVVEPAGQDQVRLVGPGLAALRRLGVRISVDAFGAGRGPLGLLLSSQVDELRLDRSAAVGGDADVLVRAAVGLAGALGLTVVADGVADAATADRMAALGCDLLQGPAVGRPCSAAQAGTLVGVTEGLIDLTGGPPDGPPEIPDPRSNTSHDAPVGAGTGRAG